MLIFFATAITCSLSNPPNGNISFSVSADINGRYSFGTTATYSCNIGYSLVPSPTVRTCAGDGSSTFGSFDGSEPVCEGKIMKLTTLLRIKNYDLLRNNLF